MQYAENQYSPWFPGRTLPVRHGLYEVKQLHPEILMKGWFENGVWKLMVGSSIYQGVKLTDGLVWRGLNFEAKLEPARPKPRSISDDFLTIEFG